MELKRLEDLSEAIVQDFARMRKNEEEMRDTNGKKKSIAGKKTLLRINTTYSTTNIIFSRRENSFIKN